MDILHVVHDFLPKHRAGTEIYVHQLSRQLALRHRVSVLCAEYDPSRRHGAITTREYDGIPVAEITNNWRFPTFEETYESESVAQPATAMLRKLAPDVVHVHSLLTLGISIPERAAALGIPTVLTLHDYALVCPSGGKRVHLSERHVCDEIDVERCASCFPESALNLQMVTATLVPDVVRRAAIPVVRSLARGVPQLLPRLRQTASRMGTHPTPADIETRLHRVRRALKYVHTIVAPSPFIADEFARLGFADGRIEVSDNGHGGFEPLPRNAASGKVRIGFVGTLAWEKGVHVLIEAVRQLRPATFELQLFGGLDTCPDYVATLRHQAAGLPVLFRGGFSPERIADVFSQIDVLVVPSLWPENSPLVVHEAFIAGVPVVAARVGGLPFLLTEQLREFLYDAHSAGDLARILQPLIDDPHRRAMMSSQLPAVKSIEEDGVDWERRYLRALADGVGRRNPGAN